jgi:hypothetical protein
MSRDSMIDSPERRASTIERRRYGNDIEHVQEVKEVKTRSKRIRQPNCFTERI